MTQRVGSATRTPDVEAVAVVRIVRRADQVHTVSPTSSRHRQVVKHDALDLGDEGGQHHAVRDTNRAILDKSTCSLSSSSQLRRTHVMSSVLRIVRVRRADQVHTVSPTSSRHRQVVKHDALDLGDGGGQHHDVNHARDFRQKHVLIVIVITTAQNTRDVIWQRRSVFRATPDGCPEQ